MNFQIPGSFKKPQKLIGFVFEEVTRKPKISWYQSRGFHFDPPPRLAKCSEFHAEDGVSFRKQVCM